MRPSNAVAASLGRLEQFDGITIWVFELNLLAARTCLHLIPQADAGCFHPKYVSGQIVHSNDKTIPPAWFLLATVRQRTRT